MNISADSRNVKPGYLTCLVASRCRIGWTGSVWVGENMEEEDLAAALLHAVKYPT